MEQLQRDVQIALAACAKQVILPEVKVGEAVTESSSLSTCRSLKGTQATAPKNEGRPGNLRITPPTAGMSAGDSSAAAVPVLQVPQHIPHPAWFPPTGSLLPEIAALDLNCSLPAHAAACTQAAASNSYEGASTVLTTEEAAALLEVREDTPCCLVPVHAPCL